MLFKKYLKLVKVFCCRNLNWPDFLLHNMATRLRDMKIAHYKNQFGFDIVEKTALRIRSLSEQLADECLAEDKKMSHDFGRKIVHLREAKQQNRTCKRMIFQGPATSKYFQGKFIQSNPLNGSMGRHGASMMEALANKNHSSLS